MTTLGECLRNKCDCRTCKWRTKISMVDEVCFAKSIPIRSYVLQSYQCKQYKSILPNVDEVEKWRKCDGN